MVVSQKSVRKPHDSKKSTTRTKATKGNSNVMTNASTVFKVSVLNPLRRVFRILQAWLRFQNRFLIQEALVVLSHTATKLA